MDQVADGTYRVQFVPTAQASVPISPLSSLTALRRGTTPSTSIVAGAARQRHRRGAIPPASPQTATASVWLSPSSLLSDEPALPSSPAPSEGSSGDPAFRCPRISRRRHRRSIRRKPRLAAAPGPDGSVSQEPTVTPSAASESPTAEPTNSTTPEQPGADAPADLLTRPGPGGGPDGSARRCPCRHHLGNGDAGGRRCRGALVRP